jgi:hypothetical protein
MVAFRTVCHHVNNLITAGVRYRHICSTSILPAPYLAQCAVSGKTVKDGLGTWPILRMCKYKCGNVTSKTESDSFVDRKYKHL